MEAVRFIVPGTPVAKGRPRIGSRGGRPCAFTPPKTVAYEGMVALAGQQAMAGRELLDGPLRLCVTAFFPIPASWSKKKRAEIAGGYAWHTLRPDGDNIAKAIGDALNGVVFRDDSIIASMTVLKVYSDTPGVEVEVSTL